MAAKWSDHNDEETHPDVTALEARVEALMRDNSMLKLKVSLVYTIKNKNKKSMPD